MSLNYHELTMNEPRDSPARRKQFLVICSIMTVMTIHSGLQAGAIAPLDIDRTDDDRFPGGEFVYKFMTKDYAATTGTLRTVADDLGIVEEGGGGLILVEGVEMDTADLLYSVLLDDAGLVPGGKTRYAAGALINGSGKEEKAGGAALKQRLLEANANIGKDTADEVGVHSRDVKYEVGRLPSVEAAVAQHPFTAGAWSAVLQNYKIVPKFRKYAEENGVNGGVIVSTCSLSQQMCTYYMPLSKRDEFYLGRPMTEEYANEFADATKMQFAGIEFDDDGFTIGGINFAKVFRGLKRAAFGGTAKKAGSSEGEL